VLRIDAYTKVWSIAPFALLHNTLRRELIDLLVIVESLQQREGQLEQVDKDQFEEWWKLFQQLVNDVFAFENRIFFPWVFGVKLENGKFDPRFIKVKEEIMGNQQASARTFLEISLLLDKLKNAITVESLNAIFKDICPVMMKVIISFTKYLAQQERSLQKLIETTFKEEDLKKVEDKLVTAVLASDPNGQIYFAMMVRGCGSEDAAELKAYLGVKDRFNWPTWLSRLKKEHTYIVKIFRDKNPNPSMSSFSRATDISSPLHSPTLASPRASGRLAPGSPRASGRLAAGSPTASGRLNAANIGSGRLNVGAAGAPASPRASGRLGDATSPTTKASGRLGVPSSPRGAGGNDPYAVNLNNPGLVQSTSPRPSGRIVSPKPAPAVQSLADDEPEAPAGDSAAATDAKGKKKFGFLSPRK